MIACISPADIHVGESLNTLRYAQRSSSINNSICQNIAEGDKLPLQYTALLAENRKLRARLSTYKRRQEDYENETRMISQYVVQSPSICSINENSADFSSIRAKLRLAEEEAKISRAYCKSFKSQSERLKDSIDFLGGKSAVVSQTQC